MQVGAAAQEVTVQAVVPAQCDLPVNSVASPIFGTVTAAEQPRVLQLGLKVNF
jgi:hypothetical protein